MKKNNYYVGHFAEKIALFWLLMKGYMPLHLNYVTGRGTGAGEVDLIVKKGKTLVFVEVKKRQNLTTAGEAITPQNKRRVTRASEVFLRQNKAYQNHHIRFDAILFSSHLFPHHIKDAWRL